MSMMLIALLVVLLPPLQTGATRTASAMQPDDENHWQTVEAYISNHTKTKFSHGICPACYENRRTVW